MVEIGVRFSSGKTTINKLRLWGRNGVVMFDNRIQSLARQFNETGEGELEYLQARLAAGEVTEVQLAIASYCGHSMARQLCHYDEESFAKVVEPNVWVKNIPTISQDRILALRVAGSIGHQSMLICERARQHHNVSRQAILSALRCLENPSEVNGYAAFRSMAGVTFAFDNVAQTACRMCFIVSDLAASVIFADQDDAPADIVRVLVERGMTVFTGGEMVQFICDSLIPWVLGYNDPLLDLLAELEKGKAG